MFKNSLKLCAAYTMNRVVSVFDKVSKSEAWPKDLYIKDIYSLSGRALFAICGLINTNACFGNNLGSDDGGRDKTSPLADIDAMALTYLAHVVNIKQAAPETNIQDISNGAFDKLLPTANLLIIRNILSALNTLAGDESESVKPGYFKVVADKTVSSSTIMDSKGMEIGLKYVRYLVAKSSGNSALSQSVAAGILLKLLDDSFREIDAAYSDAMLLKQSSEDMKALGKSTESLALKIALDAVTKAEANMPKTELSEIIKRCVEGMVLGQAQALSKIFHESCGTLCIELLKRKSTDSIYESILASGLGTLPELESVINNIRMHFDGENIQIKNMSPEELHTNFSELFGEYESDEPSLLKNMLNGSDGAILSGLLSADHDILRDVTVERAYDDVLLKKDSVDLFDHESALAAYAAHVVHIGGDESDSDKETSFATETSSGKPNISSKLFN